MASNADRGSVANGAARRTSSNHSSTSHSSSAAAAMVCWASMSSGFVGTAHAPRSRPEHALGDHGGVQQVGPVLREHDALEISPTWCPARPMRCSPLATDGGDSTCITRSTAPMSMPSSRLDVATTQRSRPDFRSSSTSARCSLLTEPWWARASTGRAPAGDARCARRPRPAVAARAAAVGRSVGRNPSPAATATGSACRSAQISLSRAVSRSASRREFANTIVDRCSSTSSRIASSTCGHTEPEPDSPARSDMSSTGTVTRRSNFLPHGGAHDRLTGRAAEEPRDLSCGRTVADSPMRCAGAP